MPDYERLLADRHKKDKLQQPSGAEPVYTKRYRRAVLGVMLKTPKHTVSQDSWPYGLYGLDPER